MSREALAKMIEEDEFGLLEVPVKAASMTPDDRLLVGFREIMAFSAEHGREPMVNPLDMGESKLAWRLRAIAGSDEQRLALEPYDEMGLLREPEPPGSLEDLLASDTGGLLDGPAEDIFTIRNVPKITTVPDRIAQRQTCEDFERFEPLFKQCHAELKDGSRKVVAFRNEQEIRADTYYLLRGALVYVAEASEKAREHGRINARLRCIFENGTEADLLLRSLSSQLYRFGKRITEPNDVTLAAMGLESGTQMAAVYVLRSLSEDPQVQELVHLHKIGKTKGSVEQRTADAIKRTTFLNAPVEILAEYAVPAGAEQKVERMLHRLFAGARLDVWFEREGVTVAEAKEWFAVPLEVIDEAIGLINTGAIANYEYDVEGQVLKLRA